MIALCWLLALPCRTPLIPAVIHRRRVLSWALSAGMFLGFGSMAAAVVCMHVWHASPRHMKYLDAREVMAAKRIGAAMLTGFVILLMSLAGKIALWGHRSA